MIKLKRLTVERTVTPNAVPLSGLRFGWIIESDAAEVYQTSYRLRIFSEGSSIYDSGTLESACSVDVPAQPQLEPGCEYSWSVEIGAVSRPGGEILRACASSSFSTGLRACDFSAKWIKPKKHREGACIYFRRDFTCEKQVKRASLYMCGLGWGNLYMNGSRVDETYFDTPFTNYEKEILYRAYDITPLIAAENAVGIHCGEGFYSQSRAWGANKEFKYGDICLLAQINVEYEDGTRQTIATDESWECAFSPAILSNVHGGEIYDARLEIPDWCSFGCSDTAFTPAAVDDSPKGELKPAAMPPCRVIRHVKPVCVTQLDGEDSGLWIYDMGENFAGMCRIKPPKSAEGSTCVLRFAETLDESGHLDFRSTGVYHVFCQQQDIYISSGKDNEQWNPEFTYHAFRYVELTGYYGREPGIDFIEGLAVSTDFDTLGKFECSDDDINRLQTLMLRTIRSNYHGFPEDCPGREKCGWLGDAQIVSDTAIYNYDMVPSYEKYLSDIRTSRLVYGDWTMIAPGKRTCGPATPLWGCAQIIIPYNMYKYCADERVLREYYPDMCLWIEHELNRSEDFIISDGLGDWCNPTGHESAGRIPINQSSTFMFYEETKALWEISLILGIDGEKYRVLSQQIADSINRHFYNSEKKTYGSYASNACAWLLGVCPAEDRQALASATVGMIESNGLRMETGIFGNKYLIPMLFESGNGETAMKLMFSRDHVSFGTMLDDNATSLWECLEMKSVGMKELVASYDHPMHSGFAFIFYALMAGIRPLKPGFSEFEIAPCLSGSPEKVRAEYFSPYGKIISERDGNKISITVPANTTCRVRLPGTDVKIGSGTYNFDFSA
ncbi:MAG: family 78 glycoside hydrolase catalytic domain [Clostridiales bacterium]|nr:family 78 glycoside hydrolase catalytic domain [Clostridiales bacterium]